MYQLLDGVKLVPVLRKVPIDVIFDLIETLVDEGIQAIEVTMDSDRAAEIIAQSRLKYGERLIVGAGTILSLEDCKQAIQAGAQFVVSPTYCEETLKFAMNSNIPMVPGVFSPTEIHAANKAGAEIVKVFPASALGPSFFKNVKGPLSHIRFMATGGINIANAKSYLDAGVDIIGAGSDLVNKEDLASHNFENIKKEVQNWLAEFTL